MSPTRTGHFRAKTQVRARPRWLKALGRRVSARDARDRRSAAPAAGDVQARLLGRHRTLREPVRTLRVVKLHRKSSLPGHSDEPGSGGRTARNERRVLESLADLRGIPYLAGPVQTSMARFLTTPWPGSTSLAIPWEIASVSETILPRSERPTPGDAPAADGLRRPAQARKHHRQRAGRALPDRLPDQPLLAAMAAAGAAVLDFLPERRLPPHETLVPLPADQCGIGHRTGQKRIPWWIRAHRLFARPVRELRRRMLVRVGVRAGKGRVETEVFAEHALRDIRQCRGPGRVNGSGPRMKSTTTGKESEDMMKITAQGNLAPGSGPGWCSPWRRPGHLVRGGLRVRHRPRVPCVVPRPTFNTYPLRPIASPRPATPSTTSQSTWPRRRSSCRHGACLEAERDRLWLAALAISLAGFWHAATPGPLMDGWHGLGWRGRCSALPPRFGRRSGRRPVALSSATLRLVALER